MSQLPLGANQQYERKEVIIINKTILLGRLTADPDIRYTQGNKPMCIARFTLAVDRRFKRDGEPSADFINCVAFGKSGEFAEKYYKKGIKIAVTGRIQTGSYTNKDGQKVYTTDVIIEEQEFAESKAASAQNQQQAQPQGDAQGIDNFMNIPDSIDEEIPFS